jgi:hypothetical protein
LRDLPPFAVFLTVLARGSDDADSELSLAASNVIQPDGSAAVEAVFASLRKSPSQLLDLQKTAVDYHLAVGRRWDAYRTVGPVIALRRQLMPSSTSPLLAADAQLALQPPGVSLFASRR